LNRVFRDSAEKAFLGHRNAENDLTNTIWRSLNAENELKRSFDPLIRGLHNSAEMAFSGRQKTENELTQL